MKAWVLLWVLVLQKDVIWQELPAVSYLMRGEFPLWSNTKPRVCFLFMFFWESLASLKDMTHTWFLNLDFTECVISTGSDQTETYMCVRQVRGHSELGEVGQLKMWWLASTGCHGTAGLWAALFVFASESVWLKPSVSLIRMWLCESAEGISKTASYRCHVSSCNFPFFARELLPSRGLHQWGEKRVSALRVGSRWTFYLSWSVQNRHNQAMCVLWFPHRAAWTSACKAVIARLHFSLPKISVIGIFFAFCSLWSNLA